MLGVGQVVDFWMKMIQDYATMVRIVLRRWGSGELKSEMEGYVDE